MADEQGTAGSEPAEEMIDADRFWSAAEALEALEAPPEVETTPALKLAGPLPFARSGFPIMGFLATIYDQVAGHARGETSTADGEAESP